MTVSINTLKRLPVYLNYIKRLPSETKFVSANQIARALNMGEVQVRKDLGLVCHSGRPKVGFEKDELILSIMDFLGYNERKKAILVGAGKLGEALMGYDGFRDFGLDIIAAFDIKNVGSTFLSKPIYSLDVMPGFCKKEDVKIGIITVPSGESQSTADLMVKSGIKAIWSFSSIHLDVPGDVIVHDENMAASLALLTRELFNQTNLGE